MYHSFSVGRAAHDPYDLHVDVAAFDDQLSRLLARGWQALDLDGYLRWRPGDRPGFLVTVDDGFAAALHLALPVLARHRVPSVWMLPAGLLGGTTRWLAEQPDEPILAADDIPEMQRHGAEIGAHSWDHPDMRGLSAAELARNTAQTRAALADAAGVPPRSFAYPFGYHDAAARDAVRSAGYAVGFAIHEDVGAMAVSRLDVKPQDTRRSLDWKLLPGYRQAWRVASHVQPLRAALRRVAQGR